MKSQQELFEMNNGRAIKVRLVMMKADLGLIRRIHATQFKEMHGWSDRMCRAIAEASEGEVISTNQGYLLNRNASADEFTKANSRIFDQARKMLRRALKERSFRHNAIGRHDHVKD